MTLVQNAERYLDIRSHSVTANIVAFAFVVRKECVCVCKTVKKTSTESVKATSCVGVDASIHTNRFR